MIKSIIAGVILSFVICLPVNAFTVDSSIKILRFYDGSGTVFFEFIGKDSEVWIDCLALDTGGNPIARTGSTLNDGEAHFSNLNVNRVNRVVCRYSD